MKISKEGLKFLKKEEGFKSKAYWDFKQWSIGYGTKATNRREEISKEIAEKRLMNHLNFHVEPIINNTIGKKINQNQFDSICSFVYNVGRNAFINSTFLKRISKGEEPNKVVREEFERWIYAGGKVNKGLVKRRNREIELFKKKLNESVKKEQIC